MRITDGLPLAYRERRPLRTYETRFLLTGFSRYDVEQKTLSTFRVDGDRILYSERVCETRTFSRVYVAEHVRVIVYSDSPKVWAEELSPHETHFFQQVAT